ncbi:acid-sensing ion channel 1C-like [Lepisosteus oculatus]|uniref:acid-sensing ion channel 1C-like n=1 Tax=Lepisosteus oculatus TaxID=7918 RepID=UPI0037155F4E
MAAAHDFSDPITPESITSVVKQMTQIPELKHVRTVKEITVSFVKNTKLHGLKYVFARDSSKPRRLLWLLAFFACVGLLSTWSWNRIYYLLSYPAVTKIHMLWAQNLSFPAVTLCNHNLFRMSSLTKMDLYYSGYWLDLLHYNHSVNEKSLQVLREDRRKMVLNLVDFSQYAPPPHFQVNTTEMISRLGHQIEDMLLECKFQGENCTFKNFTPALTLIRALHLIPISCESGTWKRLVPFLFPVRRF